MHGRYNRNEQHQQDKAIFSHIRRLGLTSIPKGKLTLSSPLLSESPKAFWLACSFSRPNPATQLNPLSAKRRMNIIRQLLLPAVRRSYKRSPAWWIRVDLKYSDNSADPYVTIAFA
jgi:hypothetical protein